MWATSAWPAVRQGPAKNPGQGVEGGGAECKGKMTRSRCMQLHTSSSVLVAEQRSPCATQEFGLPSSHTMNTLCLQFYFVHYLIEHELVSNSTAGKQCAHLRRPLPCS